MNALKSLAIGTVRAYQVAVSPLFGPRCRFHPTCSQYMIEAIQRHGLIRGVARGMWRILRCNPLCRGGYDPVA